MVLRSILLSLCLFVLSCRPACNPSSPTSILDRTVALTNENGPFCAGVWVSQYQILTAGHCLHEFDSEDPIGVSERLEIAPFETPYATHRARVVAVEKGMDLGLIEIVYPDHLARHEVARVAPVDPDVGEPLLFAAHPMAIAFTFFRGSVAAWRRTDIPPVTIQGPLLQVQAPMAPGCSGGGAFDSSGRLVGIGSFLSRASPDMGFYIPRATILAFLEKNHVLP